MVKYGEYVIVPDEHCYVVGKPKTRIDKNGKEVTTIQGAKYYGSFQNAIIGLMEACRKDVLSSQDMTLKEALERVKESDSKILRFFELDIRQDV